METIQSNKIIQSNEQIKTSFNIKPSDGIFRNIIIKSIGADNMTLLQEISKDDTIFFKVLSDDNIEYKIYKALKVLKNKIPNMIKIYGSFGCVISKKAYEKLKKKYEVKTGEKVDIKLCDSYDTSKIEQNNNLTTDSSNIKLKFIALENLINYTRIDVLLGDKVLPNDMFLSIFIQGLYQLFNYYNTFGIIHNDYNDGNIMISIDREKTDEIIKYEFGICPYRAYKNVFGFCDYLQYYDDKIINVKTYGIKLFLVDFDHSIILHTDYCDRPKDNINLRLNIIADINNFVTALYKYAPNQIKEKLIKFHKSNTYTNLVSCCKRTIEEYNGYIEKDSSRNDYFIQKTSYIFQHYIREIIDLLKMPKEYNIYK
jgi:hypothetical protein